MKTNEIDDELTREIIGCAMRVHSALGPGLLENAYRACLVYELKKSRFDVQTERPLPIVYEDVRLEVSYRLDIPINDAVVLELKALDTLAPIHTAQLISYLKLGNYPRGLLINFNVIHLRDGIKQVYLPSTAH